MGMSQSSENKKLNMKFKILSLFAVLLATGSVMAQSVHIKAGLNLANISISDNGSVDDAKKLTSFQVGLVGDIPLGSEMISLQPGILYTGKGSKTQSGSSTSSTYSIQTFNPKYVEIPANVVFKVPFSKYGRVFAGAGPYLGIGVAGKNKVEGSFAGVAYSGEKAIKFSNDDPTTTSEDEGAGYGIMRRFDYGLNGIAGIETSNTVFSVNYGYGLAKLQSGTNSASSDINKHRVLSFSVGFKF